MENFVNLLFSSNDSYLIIVVFNMLFLFAYVFGFFINLLIGLLYKIANP